MTTSQVSTAVLPIRLRNPMVRTSVRSPETTRLRSAASPWSIDSRGTHCTRTRTSSIPNTSAPGGARSRPRETLTRVGFVGYGLLRLAVAWLAIQLVIGHQPGETSQSGAFQTLAGQPLGRFVLIVVVIGLAAMAVWQALLAAVGHRSETGAERTFERVASVGRTVVYAALAWTALRVLTGTPTSSAQQQQNTTAGILPHGPGRVLVLVFGLDVLALGIGMAVYCAKCAFQRQLMTAPMEEAN